MAEEKKKQALKRAAAAQQFSDDELRYAAQASGEDRVIDATKFDYASRDPMQDMIVTKTGAEAGAGKETQPRQPSSLQKRKPDKSTGIYSSPGMKALKKEVKNFADM